MLINRIESKSKPFNKILLFFWILVLLAINSTSNDLFLINNLKTLLANTHTFGDFLNNYYLHKNFAFIWFNFFRTISVFIIFFTLIIWTLNINKKINYFIFFYFLYSSWQIIALHINSIKTFSDNILEDYKLITFNLCILLIFFLVIHYNYRKIYNKFIYIIISFISLISIYFCWNLIVEFINSKIFNLYGSVTLAPESKTFLQATPRVTGLARMLVIIFYFIFFLGMNFKKNIRYFFLFILFFIHILIYGMQSRGGELGILIFIFYYILIFDEKNIIKFKTIIIIVILPIIFWNSLVHLKKLEYKTNNNSNFNATEYFDGNRITNLQSSGRKEIWLQSLEIIKEKKIIWGIGPQADRKLLTKYQVRNYDPNSFDENVQTIIFENSSNAILDNNTSNALLYSYLCGGIVSTFFLILIYFLSIKQIFITIFLKKINKNKFEDFCAITLIFFIFRSVYENSFSVFGLDSCLFILCYVTLFKYNLNKITT